MGWADRARIEHMITSARDAMAILGEDDAEALGADMVRTRAIVNCFTEIGEAAARLTDQGRALAASVPWRQIVGMRHTIVHVYWNIDLREIVKTIRDDLPLLLRALEDALAQWPESGESPPT